MRRYDDPVEVRRGALEEPEQFLWRGRLWKVRAVVARWAESGAWWPSDGPPTVLGADEEPTHVDRDVDRDGGREGDLVVERELWRVEAGRGGLEDDAVFDLSFDGSEGRWQLVGCQH